MLDKTVLADTMIDIAPMIAPVTEPLVSPHRVWFNPFKDMVNRSKLESKSMTYIRSSSSTYGGRWRDSDSNGFQPLEYNLAEIDEAEDVDSYVFQSNFKKTALAIKEGYSFSGRNTTTSKYIKLRFRQLELAQQRTMLSLFSELLGNLFRYHMAVIVKTRSLKASGGKMRTDGKTLVKPVAGLFSVSPQMIEVKMGKNNQPIKWRHKMPDGRSMDLDPRDVCVITMNKRSHFIAPTPPWFPVLDDVAALRRIEEHLENLIYQHVFPLFIYTVGTPDKPARVYKDGSDEITETEVKLKQMPTDGMLVVPERHKVTSIGGEGRALKSDGMLAHYKQRIIAGSGLSAIDFGDGNTANRSTAETMSKLAIGSVKYAQKMFYDAINFEIIRELLLEGGFKFDPLEQDNVVVLEPNEIDIEAQIKKENHLMLMFAGNILTRTEARIESGREALEKSQEADINSNIVHATAMKAAKVAAALAPKVEPAAEEKEDPKKNGSAKNKQQPTNQHGKKSGPEKKKSSSEAYALADSICDSALGIRNEAGLARILGQISKLKAVSDGEDWTIALMDEALRWLVESVIEGEDAKKAVSRAKRMIHGIKDLSEDDNE